MVRGPGAGGGSGLHRLTGGNRSSKRYAKLGTEDDTGNGNSSTSLTFRGFCKILFPFFLPTRASGDVTSNRQRTCATYLAVVLSKSSNVVSPLFISRALNALVTKDYDTAVHSIIVYSFLKFLTVACKELQTILFIKIKQDAAIQLAEQTFAHVHTLSLNWHLTSKTGNVLRAIDRGTDASSQLVILIFLYLGPALLEALVVIIIFYTQLNQLVLGTAICVSILVYSFLTVVLTTYKKKNREATNKMDNDFHDRAADSILNFETVKYFCMEAYETRKFKESVTQYQNSMIETQKVGTVLNVSQQMVISVTLAVCLIYATSLVISDDIDLGAFIAINVYINQLFNPLSYLGQIYSGIMQSIVDVQNLSDLLDEASDISDVPNAKPIPLSVTAAAETEDNIELKLMNSTPRGVSVVFDSVSFSYPTQPKDSGIRNLSFKVPSGTSVGIVGKTGACKTTLTRLLFRFYDPQSGQITINGYNIKNYTQQSVRENIGIVPQDTILFNDTILHNIRYGRIDASMEEVEKVAIAAQLMPFIMSLPDKWETKVGERGLKLSGGEKQRVSIARCLLKNPPIIVLDEATASLDSLTENAVQESINCLSQGGRTMLVVAHRLSTIKACDNIIVMDSGTIVEQGSHEALMGIADGYYRQLYLMQASAATSTGDAVADDAVDAVAADDAAADDAADDDAVDAAAV